MEVTPRSSTDAERDVQPVANRPSKPCHVPTKRVETADAHAPEVGLPLRFIGLGVISLVVGTVAMNWFPELLTTYHYNQQIIAFTHLFVLGWVSSVVIGSVYQLVPVALETRLHSEKMGRWHFILHAVGLPGMIAMFWIWNMKQVGHFGSLYGFGVGLLAWNIFKTLRKIERWTPVAFGVASSIGWLVATVFLGLFIAATKCWPIAWFDPIAQMHAHAHCGLMGCFITLIVGVSYRLVPMFTLSEIQSPRRAWISLILLNLGTVAVAGSILLAPALKTVAGVICGAGLVVYGVELRAIHRSRKRKGVDLPVRFFLSGVGLLGIVGALGLLLSRTEPPATQAWAQLETVYGVIAVLGVISMALLGMLHKIVPFLVWYSSYSRHIGRAKLPTLSELYSTPLLKWSAVIYTTGVFAILPGIALSSTIAVRAGWLVVTAGVLGFGVNLGLIVRHLVFPTIPPQTAARKSETPKPTETPAS